MPKTAETPSMVRRERGGAKFGVGMAPPPPSSPLSAAPGPARLYNIVGREPAARSPGAAQNADFHKAVRESFPLEKAGASCCDRGSSGGLRHPAIRTPDFPPP